MIELDPTLFYSNRSLENFNC